MKGNFHVPFLGEGVAATSSPYPAVTGVDVRNFTICLSPGDVWTAALTSAGPTSSTLIIGSVGSCDGAIAGTGFTPPPLPNQQVPVGATFGYVEAYTMEAGGGDDVIWGVATPVDVIGGFSSSYNATALVNFNATSEASSVANNKAVSAALAREGGVDKEILLTRYTAGDIFAAATQVVLTFPAGFQPGEDPVSMFFFDEDEHVSFSPRHIFLPHWVNVCTIEPVSSVTRIFCPTTAAIPVNSFDVLGSPGTLTGGWVRIINNGVGAEISSIGALPVTRFPVIGLVFSTFSSGVARFDQSFPIQWAAVVGAGGFGGANSFNISSTFAPWFLPGAVLVTPGDNATGALNTTGAPAP